ncbi:MAG: FkbM family methyltransferase [Opitutaceae bacterium]
MCGTGFWATVFLHYAGPLDVVAVVDDYHAGEVILGHACINTEQLLSLVRKRPDIICINSGQSDAGYSHFERLGLEFHIRMLNYLQAIRALQIKPDIRVSDWMKTILSRADDFRETERLLCDDSSVETLYSSLLYHLETDREYLLAVNRPADAGYFRSGLFQVQSGEVYVDGGAFTGDSVQTFIQAAHGQFRQIHAYEPDPVNYQQLEAWLARQSLHGYDSRIALHLKAVGDESRTLSFNQHSNAGSYISHDTPSGPHPFENINQIDVPCVTLDHDISEPISLLKLDIEGHELKALKGASGHLKRSKPKLAVCAYHLPTDLIDLPQFIAGLEKGYRIGLRHHSNVRYDTILYAF